MSRSYFRPISGVEIMERCLNRAHREAVVFANLSPEAADQLSAITSTMSYPSGTLLFAHPRAVPGIFIVCSGRVNLFISFEDGKSLSLGVAGPGDILGLTATVSGKPYQAVAEVLESSEIKLIPRELFLKFLTTHGKVALRVAEQLCETYDQTLSELRRTGFSSTAAGRFAGFLLECPSEKDEEKNEIYIKLPLTHQKIAEIIGVRRETLTRVFNDLKKTRLLKVRGQTIIIRNRAGLELIAGRV